MLVVLDDFWTCSFVVSEDILFQEIGGETVLLNLQSEHYFGLDPIGTRIWQVLAETSSPASVVQCLITEFDVAEAQLRGDVLRLIGELVESGLVTQRAA